MADVVEVGVTIGEALHAAHQAGIVHRDVKPSNILRSRFGPALTDFGIARAPDELGSTLTREMMTPHHASPEALLHQAQSGSSDVYSLASTMWTLLVGHPPFVDPARPGLDMYAFRDRVLNDALPPMSREDVPEWLVRELTRAMSKLPAQRHASAREFADALRRAHPAPPPSAAHSSGSGRRRSPRARRTGRHPRSAGAHRPPAPDVAAPPTAPVGRHRHPGDRRCRPAPARRVAASPAAPAPPLAPARRHAGRSRSTMPSPDAAPDRCRTRPRTRAAGWGPCPPRRRQPRRTAGRDRPDRPGGSTRHARGRCRAAADSVVAVLVAVAVIAVASAAVLALNAGRGADPGWPGPADPDTTTFITAQGEGAPRDVKVADDQGTSVRLEWTDPTPRRR